MGVQVALWNEGSSWIGPLREYSRISTTVRTALEAIEANSAANDVSERRLQFLGWEITALIEKHRSVDTRASDLLNLIFFRELGFAIGSSPANVVTGRRLDGAGALFDTVLATRTGPPTLIAVLYAWIAETVAQNFGEMCDFDRVELVQSSPTEVVRFIERGRPGSVWLADLSKDGAKIDEEIWSQWCSAPTSNGFCRLTWAQGLVRMLTELFKLLEKMPVISLELLSAQLFVLDRIMSLQPSETSRWAERAMINTRRGDRTGALDDLKRFFAFHERETAPPAIVSLFDDLRNSTSN